MWTQVAWTWSSVVSESRWISHYTHGPRSRPHRSTPPTMCTPVPLASHTPVRTCTICSLLQTDNHTNSSSVNVYRPDALRNAQSTLYEHHTPGWRRGAVVSGVRRTNEVNARRARLVPGWVTVFGSYIPSRYITSQLGQLSLASLWGRLIEY